MGLKTAGVGPFTIPTAPAAGTSCTSGAANVFTTTYVQLIASTVAALYITGLHLNLQTTSKPTYVVVQLATGGAGSETIVGQKLVPLGDTSGVTGIFINEFVPIFPPIPVAISTRIAVKTADSVGAIASLVTLECIAQANVVDDGINQSANVNQWLGGACPAVTVTGVPKVDLADILGTAVSAPATAGILDVNIKNMNNVAATSITTINANQGTTQPINFTGTAASALAKSDTVDWNGTAVSTPNTAGVPIVDSRSTSLRVNTAQAGGATSITLDAGASATTDFYKYAGVSILSGTGAGQQSRIITAYNGATKVATVTPAWATNPDNTSVFSLNPAGADIESILGVAASATVAQIGANIVQLNADATSAVNLAKTTKAMGRGTVGSGSTTTSVVTSAMTPAGAVANQFINRTILFDANTTTTALQGQVAQITASTNAANPTFTVTALTTAPVSGDIFSVV